MARVYLFSKDNIALDDLNEPIAICPEQNSTLVPADSALTLLELSQEETKRGSWTSKEDDLLLAGIKKHGYGHWKEIAVSIPGRKGKQLKQRWDNTLAAKYVDQDTSDMISERIKQDNQQAIEEILLNTVKNTIDQSIASLSPSIQPEPVINYTDTIILQQQQQQQNYMFSMNQPRVKRKRIDPALASSQTEAISIFTSPTPIISTNIHHQIQTVYPCLFPNCTKTFTRLYNLKSHSKTHTDDRPFICQVCNSAFSRNHDLKRHFKIHAGAKPYQCEGCKKWFSRLDALKRHQSNQRNKQSCIQD